MDYQTSQKRRLGTSRIVAVYALFGFAWIYGSDTVLGWLVQDSSVMVKIAVIKGSLFILCTSALLYTLINLFAKQLAASEIRYKTILNTAMDGFWLVNEQGGLLKVNEAYCHMSGYGEQELLSMRIADLEVNESADDVVAHNQKIKVKGEDRFVARHRRKNGTTFDVEVSVKCLPAYDGLLVGFLRDISERKQAEQTLQYERNLSMDILNAQPAGIYRIRVFAPETWEKDAWRSSKSSPYVVELASEPFCKILGTTKEAFENNPGMVIDLIHPDDRGGFARKNEEAATDLEEFNWEGRLLIDGVIRWVRFQSLPRPLENGDVLWTGALIDITDRIKAEEEKNIMESQLQQTQKLESLGVLSGGIAHDFNNILAVIMGNCSLAKIDEENAGKFIPEIEKAAERAAELCRQMLAYAGKARFVQASVNFQSLVGEMVDMLKKTTPQNAEIKLDCTPGISLIHGDSSQLNQVVMNLIINASEAIGKVQGEIRVLLTETTINDGHPEKDYNGKAIATGSYVCLEVTDNGCGMDEETKWRIFEPFYTTKFTGRGLGMSAVLGIINSHKGALQLHSQLGQGSTFKVYLPAQINDSAQDRSVQQTIESQWRGHGTILLAEDEDQIRHIAKTFLEMFGFTVIEAVNGKEALDLYQKSASDISLVLTDMGMPVMDGYALFHALKQIKPTLPIIISSGFGEADVTARIDPDKIAGLISKPYTPEKLRDMLKSILLN
ncbi:MAG: PAS domain S-box protein [Desulfuromonadaceae bacterium]|nr:PAS domain S-box protein [Desulfuromonadaceae bacterium]MDD5105577.1 PAS domain S-box protein [Desulfuromonadaceae bacterium]